MTTAIYPGTFDPVTNGHLDIAMRAARIFDKLVIGVYAYPDKKTLFNIEERTEMMRKSVAHVPNIEVMSFSGLTIEFAKSVNALTIVRGLRMGADFEREFDLGLMNKKLSPDIELVCLMSDLKYQFLSSSLLKEAALLGADIHDLIPKHVAVALRKKVNRPM